MRNTPAVIGVGMLRVGKHPGRSPLDLAVEAGLKALRDASVDRDEVQGLFITPEGFAIPNSQMLAARLNEVFGFKGLRSLSKFECGGVSGALALRYAADDIILKKNEVCLVLASDMTFGEPPEDIVPFLRQAAMIQGGLYGPYDAPYGLGAPVPYYAMATQRYMYENGIAPESIAALPVLLRKNASKNPLAQFRDEITVEDVLSSRMVSPPVHLLECCPISDGAAALVLASPKRAKKAKKPPIWITAMGEFHDSSHFYPKEGPMTSFPCVMKSAEEAYGQARIKPKDIQVAEVYGVFAATELMVYEELGFFKKGQAADALKEGATAIGGQIAMNPSGGRLSLGHPATATPLLEAGEIVLQLRKEAGERQVSGARRGLVHAEHGMLNGSMVFILET